jgi:hypothetical protein
VNPTLLVNCRYDLPFWSSIGYLHDIYVRNDTAYCNAENRGLFVVDFSDMENPVMIGSLPVYPQQGYNHSGYLMADAPFYAMADETHGKDIKIVNVSDMQNIVVTDTITSGVHPYSIPHNLLYKDNYLYVSYYFDGMYVFDCADPAHPVLAGYYDTSTELHASNDYRGCWGVYPFLPSGKILASDMQTGLWVLDVTYPALGVDDLEPSTSNRQIRIHPNPVSENIYVDVNYINAPFVITDMLGRQLVSGQVESNGQIRITENVDSGIYQLVIGGNQPGKGRFLKL